MTPLLPAPDWVTALQEQARASVPALPSPKHEQWKYTNLKLLAGYTPIYLPPPETGAAPSASLTDSVCIACTDGVLATAPDGLPNGVTVLSLRDALAQDMAGLKACLEQGQDRPLVTLNTANLSGGLVIHIADHTVVEQPLEVIHSYTATAQQDQDILSVYPRLVLLVGQGADVTVLETLASAGAATHFVNRVSHVQVGANARVRHGVIQSLNTDAFDVETTLSDVARDGHYEHFVLSTGARLARNEMHCQLAADNATCALNGAYVADGDRHLDTTSLIEHQQPHGTSNQTYKGIIGGAGRGVFQGKIHVHPDAQKTDGYQLNQALLLSEKAEIDSKPELEIYADDVKCSHGATVGRLDEKDLFYLRSRGVPLAQARKLLIRAFLAETLDLVTHDAMRDVMTTHLDDVLEGLSE